jgi:hypothetical protein
MVALLVLVMMCVRAQHHRAKMNVVATSRLRVLQQYER